MTDCFALTTIQTDLMKHALGVQADRITGTKHRKYEAFRNYYTTSGHVLEWDGLVCQGLASINDFPQGGGEHPKVYRVTSEGMKALGDIMEIEITEGK
jgi:hypothetical protein